MISDITVANSLSAWSQEKATVLSVTQIISINLMVHVWIKTNFVGNMMIQVIVYNVLLSIFSANSHKNASLESQDANIMIKIDALHAINHFILMESDVKFMDVWN